MVCIGIGLKPVNLAWPKSIPLLLIEALVSAGVKIRERKAVIDGGARLYKHRSAFTFFLALSFSNRLRFTFLGFLNGVSPTKPSDWVYARKS